MLNQVCDYVTVIFDEDSAGHSITADPYATLHELDMQTGVGFIKQNAPEIAKAIQKAIGLNPSIRRLWMSAVRNSELSLRSRPPYRLKISAMLIVLGVAISGFGIMQAFATRDAWSKNSVLVGAEVTEAISRMHHGGTAYEVFVALPGDPGGQKQVVVAREYGSRPAVGSFVLVRYAPSDPSFVLPDGTIDIMWWDKYIAMLGGFIFIVGLTGIFFRNGFPN